MVSRTKSSLWFSTALWMLIVLFHITMVPQQSWAAKQDQTNICFSSCGKISNISYPFRRKDDPHHCGDSRYELECVNHTFLVLRLSDAAEYHVEAINYNNYTIRLVDPNVKQTDCSSIPTYFLHKYNFSDAVKEHRDDIFYPPNHRVVDTYHATQIRNASANDEREYDDQYLALFDHIIYMRCKNESSYVNKDNISCLDPYTHVFVGDLYAKDWKPGCHINRIAATSGLFRFQRLYIDVFHWGSDERKPLNNIPYSDIHKALVYGFELSWLHVSLQCQHRCGSSTPCYFNQTTGEVLCYSPPCIHYGSHRCGIWQRIRIYYLGHLQLFLNGMSDLIRLKYPKDWYYFSEYKYKYVISSEYVGWWGLLSLVAFRILFGITILVGGLIYKWRRRHLSIYINIENFLQDNNFMPIRYSYKDIKKMSRNFKMKLGQGGFGSVYKGKLRSGPHVAIKMLDKFEANGQDFINEVATIGRIHHVNVVRLIGFCVEGSKRALVYDYMSNGSLDKYIFSKDGNVPLSYEKIFEISLEVANGISYLHQGCDIQILHFDIKPHNILLDENFIPKVSDFGLAKLYPTDRSVITLTDKRGTIGYIAPELFYSNIGGISYKADVYSFGMLLMEMANKQKNLNPQADNSSQFSKVFFPTWVYGQLCKGKEIYLDNATEDEKNIIKKMIMVALWCIQLKPYDRPSMKQVVEMLEGELENLAMPPELLLYPNDTFVNDGQLTSEQITLDQSANDISDTYLGKDETANNAALENIQKT